MVLVRGDRGVFWCRDVCLWLVLRSDARDVDTRWGATINSNTAGSPRADDLARGDLGRGCVSTQRPRMHRAGRPGCVGELGSSSSGVLAPTAPLPVDLVAGGGGGPSLPIRALAYYVSGWTQGPERVYDSGVVVVDQSLTKNPAFNVTLGSKTLWGRGRSVSAVRARS